uniref:Putative secreted protein n=1 Tax=Amblyomma triste TaxID=251400 RepID=A0A023G1B5_AMBTT
MAFKAALYIMFSCSTLLRLRELVYAQSSDGDGAYDYYTDDPEENTTTTQSPSTGTPCPDILHLMGETNARPLGCRYGCHGSNILPVNTSCYVC